MNETQEPTLNGGMDTEALKYNNKLMAQGALTPVGAMQASPEQMAKWKAEKEEQERLNNASHSIAQAAFILSLFHKEDLFRYSAGTAFAMALSKLAISAITENGKVFDDEQ